MKKAVPFVLSLFAVLVIGCGDAAPTKAPPVTGKVPDWKAMSKEEKIEVINKQPMPDAARTEAIRRIEQGID
jgi:hypothetical protein